VHRNTTTTTTTARNTRKELKLRPLPLRQADTPKEWKDLPRLAMQWGVDYLKEDPVLYVFDLITNKD
jgi:hypothetical protein